MRARTARAPAGRKSLSWPRTTSRLRELDGFVGVGFRLLGQVGSVGVARLRGLQLRLLEMLFGVVVFIRRELFRAHRLGLFHSCRRRVDHYCVVHAAAAEWAAPQSHPET